LPRAKKEKEDKLDGRGRREKKGETPCYPEMGRVHLPSGNYERRGVGTTREGLTLGIVELRGGKDGKWTGREK